MLLLHKKLLLGREVREHHVVVVAEPSVCLGASRVLLLGQVVLARRVRPNHGALQALARSGRRAAHFYACNRAHLQLILWLHTR